MIEIIDKFQLSDTALRLVEATLDAWAEHSSGEVSARAIAAKTGGNASSIYYHFTDIEHLYEASQNAALKAASQWCAAQITALSERSNIVSIQGAALGPLLAALIDDWCEGQRRLAFAWRQCQLMAARNPRFASLRHDWAVLWGDFWRDICGRFGLEDCARLTALFFDGESFLHLMRWSRLADRAGLDEMCGGWALWMIGTIGTSAPWRTHMRAEARGDLALDMLPDGVPRQIASAATQLLAREGAGSVTHRAVAANAGLTLGVVSHHCRRTDDLLRFAFSDIYWRLTGASPIGAQSIEQASITRRPDGWELLAIDELILAVARGRAGPELVPRLRYLRGSTSRHTVMERLGSRAGDAVLESAICSSVMMGLGRTNFGRPEEERSMEYGLLSDQLFARIR